MPCLSDIPEIQIGRRATEKNGVGGSPGLTAVQLSSSVKSPQASSLAPRTGSKDVPGKQVTRTGGLSRSASGSGLTAVRTMSRTQSPAGTPRAAGASSPKLPRPGDNFALPVPDRTLSRSQSQAATPRAAGASSPRSPRPGDNVALPVPDRSVSRSRSQAATPRAAGPSSPKSPRPAYKAASHARLPCDLPRIDGNACASSASSSPRSAHGMEPLAHLDTAPVSNPNEQALLQIPGRRSHSFLPHLPALSPRASSDIGCYVPGWSDSCTATPRSDAAATPRLCTEDLLKPSVALLTKAERRATLAKAQSDTDSSCSAEDEIELEFEASEEVKALKNAYTREPKSMWALVNKEAKPKRRLNIADQRHIQRQMLLRTAEKEAAEKERVRQRNKLLQGL
eukprot:TRINITY_DN4727_c0_g1_i1.p1 TRINITY_DN4727_c0_g1~~TRINITY_DN4727_c0_g1_i1.p1  ORF type:complete len:396 (-),score=50.30 TRINITY_DN4727_c0_g1_i1:73-1260(-)